MAPAANYVRNGPSAQSGNGAYYPGPDAILSSSRRHFVGLKLSTNPLLGPLSATSCKLVIMTIAACSCQTRNGGTSRAPLTGSVESRQHNSDFPLPSHLSSCTSVSAVLSKVRGEAKQACVLREPGRRKEHQRPLPVHSLICNLICNLICPLTGIMHCQPYYPPLPEEMQRLDAGN